MMLNNDSRIWLASGVWFAAVGTIVACSLAVGASLSSSAFLLVLCASPLAVALLMGFVALPPAAAELLHAVNPRREGRS